MRRTFRYVVFTLMAMFFSVFATTDRCQAASYTITDLGSAFFPTGVNASGVVAGSLLPPIARAARYSSGTIDDLGILPAPFGGGESWGEGINATGQIVGHSSGDFGDGVFSHAFSYASGTMTDIGALAPAGTDSYGHDINDVGQIVGLLYSVSSLGTHAFLYSSGSVTDLGTLPGGAASQASAINNSGQVVGSSGTATGFGHAFSYASGVMTDLGVLPGADSSAAFDVNDSGQIVGASSSADGSFAHPFLYEPGTMVDLGLPLGATNGTANAINASGQVVGDSNSGPFLYSDGSMQHLFLLVDPLSGWLLNTAVSISDTGEWHFLSL